MPESARETINKTIQDQEMSLAELGRQLGVDRRVISRTVKHVPIVNPRSLWGRILDHCGLEIVLQKKDA